MTSTRLSAPLLKLLLPGGNGCGCLVDASLVAAANYGLKLVQGMNDINEIVTTLGNAVALGQAITAEGNNSDAQAAILALLNHLAESNNAAVANAC